MTKKQKKMLVRIVVTFFLQMLIGILNVHGHFRFLLYMIPYLIIGYDILKKAFLGIIKLQVMDENFLMTVATLGAIVLAVNGKGDYTEAVAVMLFYQVGELFQNYAVGKSRKNISELMDIRGDYVNIEENGTIVKKDPDEIEIGTVITVLPGEKISIDGEVVFGESTIDTASLTGESMPKKVQKSMNVMSGYINLTGVLKIRTTKSFENSTASKILELVENASSNKSITESFISKFAKIYTPSVVTGALIIGILFPVIRTVFLNAEPAWSEWFYRALTFLVISCPCALVISIPLTFFACLGGASKKGILIKGSNYIEALSKTDTVVFDKTGTLTKASFEVSKVNCDVMSSDELIELASLAESTSLHPIAKSILKAYNKLPDIRRVSESKEISGEGIISVVDGEKIAVGNAKLMERIGVEYRKYQDYGTVVHVAKDHKYAGYIVISDDLKDNSKDAISDLKRINVKSTVMLTGDNAMAAQKISQNVGIDTFYAQLLPHDKVNIVEKLIKNKNKKKTLVFVGDGINDAPVLARSDIGIAMGAIGTDAAIEAADVVLMDDNPQNVAKAIKISRRCMKIVYENITFSLFVKVVCLLLGAAGIANMWLAIFADVGVMVIAVLNALRILFIKRI